MVNKNVFGHFFLLFESISDILVPKRKKSMLSDYINLAQNIRNSYLVRILSSKREELDIINYQYANALNQKYGFNENVRAEQINEEIFIEISKML